MNRCWLADNALGDRHNCSTPTSPGLSQISQQTVLRGNMKKLDKELWRFKRRTLAHFRAEKYLVRKSGKWEIEIALWASQKQEMTLWHWMTDDRWGSNSYKTLKVNTISVWCSREKGRCKKTEKQWAQKGVLAAPFAKAEGRNAVVIEMMKRQGTCYKFNLVNNGSCAHSMKSMRITLQD